MKNLAKTVFVLCSLLFVLAINAQTPAFPGAEGYGRYATGGRGGAIYYVTNLTDNNTGNTATREGSLRWCLNQNGTKTILFKVSGTIFLNSELKITKGDVTIAGQSAPGAGICIAGFPVSVSADNVIVRYVRIRMGNERDISSDGADAFGGRFHNNIIIDHCSISWSTDECCSFYNNSNFTLQWCIISESLNYGGHSKGAHGYGGIWGGFGASYHHNLMAHNKSRVPRLGPGANSTPTNELFDVRNNVYYNYAGEGCYGGEAMHGNIVNNYYKSGPAGVSLATGKKKRIFVPSVTTQFPIINGLWGSYYIDGNYMVGQADVTANNWDNGVYNQISPAPNQTLKDQLRLTEPLPTDVVTTHTAQNAYNKVLLYAGCSHYRDAIDTRIITETQTNTTTFKGAYQNIPGIIDSEQDLRPEDADGDWGPWCALVQTAPPADENRDGIPDAWFAANVPAGSTANSLNADGYTYLEVYLASLVTNITSNQNTGAITEVDAPKKKVTIST
ncbi:MAG: pectate lyase [Paludibacter sp.]|jgi:hypothetical protein|nr:pectate lyase [Paludibacter sp.]